MTTEAFDQNQQQEAQSEWDAVARERETGIPAAEKPQEKPIETPRAIDPLQELRDKYEKLEARTRNAEGHIGGLNHNQRLMHETLQAASKAASSVTLQQGSAAPTQAQVSEAMGDPEEWEELKRDFPEWSIATEKFLDARLARAKGQSIDPAQLARIVQEQVAGQTASVRAEVINTSLDAVYPGWQDEVKSSHFGRWMHGQPPEVKAMAQSSSVKDAAKMLALYEKAKVNSPAADIVAARKQKLANAAGAPKGIRSSPQKVEADMTKEELWALEAKRTDARRAQRY
ncbi:MAG: hypothetical protein ACHP7O_05655 [Burkholderiales bacterium]